MWTAQKGALTIQILTRPLQDRGHRCASSYRENPGRFCPELESQCRHDFEADGVTPLFFGQERGTSILIFPT